MADTRPGASVVKTTVQILHVGAIAIIAAIGVGIAVTSDNLLVGGLALLGATILMYATRIIYLRLLAW